MSIRSLISAIEAEHAARSIIEDAQHRSETRSTSAGETRSMRSKRSARLPLFPDPISCLSNHQLCDALALSPELPDAKNAFHHGYVSPYMRVLVATRDRHYFEPRQHVCNRDAKLSPMDQCTGPFQSKAVIPQTHITNQSPYRHLISEVHLGKIPRLLHHHTR